MFIVGPERNYKVPVSAFKRKQRRARAGNITKMVVEGAQIQKWLCGGGVDPNKDNYGGINRTMPLATSGRD